MESRLLSLLETEPYGVDVDKMIGRLGAFASDEQAAFNVALNALVTDGLLEIVQFGYNFRAKVKAIEPPGPAGLTLEESVLNSLVIDAGNKGISITKLREQTGLWQPPMRTALKSLEQKKLIKAVKSVATTREWCYMPYDAVEDASFTGGTFCSDRQLDDDLDKVYSDFRRYKNLMSSKEARQDDKELVKTPIDVVTID